MIEIKPNKEALRIAETLSINEFIEKVRSADLRGRSGNNFPTWIKINSVVNESKKKGVKPFIICNIEESEIGTFKDRYLIKKNPELVIEGLLILKHFLNPEKIFFYVRDKELVSIIENKLKELIPEKLKDFEIVISPGCYICGEETALIKTIEGERPIPSLKPPFPTSKGLFGKPTLIDNPETIAMIPLILLNLFDKQTQLFSISGNIEKPGVYELKLGFKLKELMNIVKPIGNPRAVLFAGIGGILPYDPELVISYESLKQKGIILGSRSLIIINDEQNLLEVFKSLAEFFSRESCGLCTPCREGNPRIVELLQKFIEGIGTEKDLQLLKELAFFIRDTSRCALGKTSTNWLITALKYFGEVFKCQQ